MKDDKNPEDAIGETGLLFNGGYEQGPVIQSYMKSLS
jgi:hypothetical protein